MAIRQTRFQIKNNQNSAAPFSGATLLVGEPIVNTASGIMMFSGVTTGTNDWTPAGVGGNAGFFEVGSNLYDLRLRNRITKYEGLSGSQLDGKILSGTSQGLILVDSTEINGISAFTYNSLTNTFTIFDSNGTEYPATISSVSGLTVNGNFNVTGATILNTVTANTISATTITVDDVNINDDVNISGDLTVNNLTVTGNTSLQETSATTFSATSVNIGGLGSNRVVYTTGPGLLTTESNFTYTEGTDTLGVNNVDASGNVVIQGSLTVFGTSVSAFTSNLYVEDNNITLNYNPTGSTTTTSVNAGFTVQDGNGNTSGDVNLDIVRMQNLTGLTITQIPSVSEYSTGLGYTNRGWITQLNDIVIRSTDITDNNTVGSINGVRVLAEFDVLDGGSY
jgi:hypothetical protein